MSTQIFIFLIVLTFVMPWQVYALNSKIHPNVFSLLENGQNPRIIADCQPSSKSGASFEDLTSSIEKISKEGSLTNSEKREKSSELLLSLADLRIETMQIAIDLLKLEQAEFIVLWTTHQFVIYNIKPEVLEKLAAIDIVTKIRVKEPQQNHRRRPNPFSRPPPQGNSTWNLGLINARCKDITCLGDGVTVGIIDTGVMYNHTELIDSWIGEPFGWWNATSDTTDTPFPTDYDGRGTFATGLAVGKSVGVAPHATWLACTNCVSDQWSCDDTLLPICGQFMLCPWSFDDHTPEKVTKDCTKRPDIVLVPGGTDYGSQLLDPELYAFYETIQLWNAVGILSVYRMGDYGPDCNTGAPSFALYDISLAVGSVDENCTIYDYSSRGPVLIRGPLTKSSTATEISCPAPATLDEKCTGLDKEEQICTIVKPDIVAPGMNLNSSGISSTTAYEIDDGTAYAAAHVAGTLALMVCANPKAQWDYKTAYKILSITADTRRIDLKGNSLEDSTEENPASSHMMCDVVLSGICEGFPNNLYGYGVVDACEAVKVSSRNIAFAK